LSKLASIFGSEAVFTLLFKAHPGKFVLLEHMKGRLMLFPRRFLPPTWLTFILILVLFEVIADVLAKQFALNGKLVFAVLSILGYVAANIAWLISLRSGGELSKGAVIFAALSGIAAVVIGLFVYKEKASPYQLIGMILGIGAIVFLAME
jgi:multidrug transporter EmrE-like cation transporter